MITKEIMEWVKSIAIAIVLAILIHTFLFAIIVVDGPSMETTLHNGEKLIMNKVVYRFHGPERGDIIVFHANEKDDYIKRVIGLPGEKIEYKDNKLYIDDHVLEEPYLGEHIVTKDFGPVNIPDGEIFVMGDNRGNSTDSRYAGLGPIPLDRVVGRVSLLIWPLNRFGYIN